MVIGLHFLHFIIVVVPVVLLKYINGFLFFGLGVGPGGVGSDTINPNSVTLYGFFVLYIIIVYDLIAVDDVVDITPVELSIVMLG